MKRRLLYPYHFNFGTSRTQGQNHALLLHIWTRAHNLPPNKRTCSRKEINALQADEDIIPYSEQTIIIDQTTQEEIIPFNRTSRNVLCLIRTTYKQKGLLFALYRTIRKQAAQHTTNETRRAHTANK